MSNPTTIPSRYPVAWIGAAAVGVVLAGCEVNQFDGPRESVETTDPAATAALDSAGYRDCANCPSMVFVRGSTFSLGSPEGDTLGFADERPQHTVTMPDFWIGVHEVTVGQWAEFRVANPDATDGCGPADEHPVACVNWNDAQAYVTWLAETTSRPYRLPTEAEWEYAARGGTTTPWFWGTDLDDVCRYANSSRTCGEDTFDGITSPVGSFQANAFGLHDTAGNLWEWIEDCWHADYVEAPDDGLAWTDDCSIEGSRVLRGGAFSVDPYSLRAAFRVSDPEDARWDVTGFRVVWRAAGGQEN